MQRFGDSQRKEGFRNHAQKNTIQYAERDEQKREEFIAEVEALPDDAELYYGDESGFDEYYSREHGYAPRGEPVIGVVSGRHFARTSIVAAKNGDDVVAPFAFSGSMNSDLFVGWLEQIFVPALKNPAKSVLFLDNASHHPKDDIFDIADEYGFKVIFLPPYSPDFNKPIENFWANVKRRLRLHMHKFQSFWDALAHAFN
jgi:transposase